MKVKPHSVIPLPQTEWVDASFISMPLTVNGRAFDEQMILLARGERDGVEIITAGVSRLIRDPDRTSTGSTQSTGNTRVLSSFSFCFYSNLLFQTYTLLFVLSKIRRVVRPPEVRCRAPSLVVIPLWR